MKTIYRFRIKDKHDAELRRQARAVSFVWNFCQETQKNALRWEKKWPSGYDLGKLAAGSSKELGLLSSTIDRVCQQYATSRAQHKKRLDGLAVDAARARAILEYVDGASPAPSPDPCSVCRGTGRVGIPGAVCGFCKGTGKPFWGASPAPSVEPADPTDWWMQELWALYVAPLGSPVTADMKRAANIARKVASGQRWNEVLDQWLAAPTAAVHEPEARDQGHPAVPDDEGKESGLARDDTLSIDPDGDVGMDWDTPHGDLLSISVSAAGRAAFAWRLGARHGHGSTQFPAEVFTILRAAYAASIPSSEGRGPDDKEPGRGQT